LERSAYRVNEIKFQSNLRPVFQNQTVQIYEVPPPDLLEAALGE
jgi:uncharacterized membrane protein